MKVAEKSLDPQLWHACAGGMVQMPSVNTKVFYFPQGHAEHAQSNVDFGDSFRIPPLILCRVASVKFLADSETDEVFSKITLIPLRNSELENDDSDGDGSENSEKPASFAKTLTQSDANNGGGFSVPRYCAETIFPRLDYSAEPPVQTVIAKDVHGEVWKFRHIYRGTPRRHLLTTGWSSFVNQKKLVAGDSIVFLRAESGELFVGIRRAKRGIVNGLETPSGWSSGNGNCGLGPYGGAFTAFLREENKLGGVGGNLGGGRVKVSGESVKEAMRLAASNQTFEVVYYPRASTPEFCIKTSAVKAAMRIQWCSGMRFKMPFETEDSSRISWFMGTISSVQVVDPIRWPNSPWRLLQVTWDEPDLLHNVKRVSPWLVELVSNMSMIHLAPFSPPRKKLRFPQHPDFPLDVVQFQIPTFSGNPFNPLCCLSSSDNYNAPAAGIQGARHAQIGISLSDLHLNNNKFQLGVFPNNRETISNVSNITTNHDNKSKESISCLLTIGNSHKRSLEIKSDNNDNRHQFLLFGQPILTEQQISRKDSSDDVLLSKKKDKEKWFFSDTTQSSISEQFSPAKSSTTSASADFCWQLGLDTGHCKVFLESEDVGRTLDLSCVGSYEELYRKLAKMFGIERSEMLSRVLYRDATGAVKQTGEEPFRYFSCFIVLSIRI
ncbi:auxin response factor 1 [Medicago truncatula]|uniref:Auxin response factor n=1 Tax=Medicago truncatula TaxID=3880 RepID=A0A072VC33_MEDTR|nr:auxin response factor 1 [Medicago truncatula]